MQTGEQEIIDLLNDGPKKHKELVEETELSSGQVYSIIDSLRQDRRVYMNSDKKYVIKN